MEERRPDDLQHMRQAFDLLKNTFLADGRAWILGGSGPSLADIDAVWPFSWLIMDPAMHGALPEDLFNQTKYPKTPAWVSRFTDEVTKRKKEGRQPETLGGAGIRSRILNASSTAGTEPIKEDPLKLQAGDEVEVFPSDYG